MLESANWLPYVPVPGLAQIWEVLNTDTVDETDACVSYSTIDSIETQLYQQTGIRVQFSRRWLAFISGTTLKGNNIVSVFDALMKWGPVLESSWPQSNAETWDLFYAAPTAAQLAALTAEGAQWKKILNFQTPEYGILAASVPAALQRAPLIGFIPAVNPDHAIEVVNLTTMFNSEPDSSNPLTEFTQPLSISNVSSFHQIIIEANMNTFVETMNYNGTVGIFIPLTSPEEIPFINQAFNVNLVVAPDGSIATQKTVVDKA